MSFGVLSSGLEQEAKEKTAIEIAERINAPLFTKEYNPPEGGGFSSAISGSPASPTPQSWQRWAGGRRTRHLFFYLRGHTADVRLILLLTRLGFYH